MKAEIEGIQLRVSVDSQTEETSAGPPEESEGHMSVIALVQSDRTPVRFLSEPRFIIQQVSPTAMRVTRFYHPEDPSIILEKHIEYLRSIAILKISFSDFFDDAQLTSIGITIELDFGLILNGNQLFGRKYPVPQGSPLTGELYLKVQNDLAGFVDYLGTKISANA